MAWAGVIISLLKQGKKVIVNQGLPSDADRIKSIMEQVEASLGYWPDITKKFKSTREVFNFLRSGKVQSVVTMDTGVFHAAHWLLRLPIAVVSSEQFSTSWIPKKNKYNFYQVEVKKFLADPQLAVEAHEKVLAAVASPVMEKKMTVETPTSRRSSVPIGPEGTIAASPVRKNAAIKLAEELAGDNPQRSLLQDDTLNFGRHIDRIGFTPGQKILVVGPANNDTAVTILALYGCEVYVVEPDVEDLNELLLVVGNKIKAFYAGDDAFIKKAMARIHAEPVHLRSFLQDHSTIQYDGVVAINILDLLVRDEGIIDDITRLWEVLSDNAQMIVSFLAVDRKNEMIRSAEQAGLNLKVEPTSERYELLRGDYNYTIQVQRTAEFIRPNDYVSSPVQEQNITLSYATERFVEETKKGGIDLNSRAIEMQMDKAAGVGLRVPVVAPEVIERFADTAGFSPVIIHVAPVINLPLLIGLPNEPPQERPRAMQQTENLLSG